MSDHAIENGRNWADTIFETMTALAALESGEAESVTVEGYEYEDADALLQRVHEMPLAVDVRSGWTTPGEHMEAAEYQITLTTGGPGLRIHGALDAHGSPANARLEWQDWGEPWQTVPLARMPEDDDAAERMREFSARCKAVADAIEAFAGRFHYGE